MGAAGGKSLRRLFRGRAAAGFHNNTKYRAKNRQTTRSGGFLIPFATDRIEQMFFVPKRKDFRWNPGIFPGKKEEKTIAILLQSIYTKEESGAKWRERPLIDSKVEGE